MFKCSPHDSSTMDGRASKVKVNISIDIHVLLLVASLDFATLLSEISTPDISNHSCYICLVLHKKCN